MKIKKIMRVFIATILIVTIIPVAMNATKSYDLLDGCWIEQIDNIKVVHLNGSFYNMGYQLGYLLKDDILLSIRAHMYGAERFGTTLEDFENLWNIQKNYISNKTMDYLQGTADALNLKLKDIGFIWIWEGVLYYKQCTSYAFWGDATINGELIHVRSLDGLGYLEDPITGLYSQEFPVLVVCNPKDDHAFLYPTNTGYSVEDGFNDMGISVCNLWSENDDISPFGSPMGVRLFEALFMSDTAEEAIEIVTTNKTFGYNYIVCDGKIPEGFAIETTANLTYVGSWDHPSEDTRPFYQIKDVIRRSNCFIDPNLSSTQREKYNPRSLMYILNYKEGYGWINCWLRYAAMSKAIGDSYGNIDLGIALDILRNLYQGKYNFFWWLMNINPCMFAEWQWAACPKTGDMLLSFISRDSLAFENKIYNFNLFELLNSEPP